MSRTISTLAVLTILLGSALAPDVARASACSAGAVDALSRACRDAVRDLCPRGLPVEGTFCTQGGLAGCSDCESQEAACLSTLGTTEAACLNDCRTAWTSDRAACGVHDDACRLRANLEIFGCKRRCARDASSAFSACSQAFVDCVDSCLPPQ